MLFTLMIFSVLLVPHNIELYYNGAVIEYSAKVNLKSGYNEVYLTNLPSGSSLLTLKTSSGIITGYMILDSLNKPAPSVKRLKVKYDSLKRAYELFSYQSRMVSGEKDMLSKLLQFNPCDSIHFSARALSRLLDTIKIKGLNLTMEEQKINAKLKILSKKMNRLKDSIDLFQGKTVKLSVYSENTGVHRVYVKFFTPYLRYTPSFSLNAIPDKRLVELKALANVNNRLKRPLHNVHISVLMQEFSYQGLADIEPERYYYDSYGVGRNYMMKSIAPKRYAEAEASTPAPPPTPAKKEEYATGTRFILSSEYSFLPGKDVSFVVFTDTMNADFIMRSYPRKYDGVYLYATVSVKKYPVYLKDVKMYVDGVYQGIWNSSTKSVVFPGDTFSANFGKDVKVTVKRESVKAYGRSTWTGNRVKDFAYKIVVKNNRKKSIKLILYDNLPLFSSDRYSLKNAKIEPGDYILNKETGIIKWEEDLKAGMKKVFTLSYSVVRK